MHHCVKKNNIKDNVPSNKDFTMLIDTHCHINMMIKKTFDTLLQESDFPQAKQIVADAQAQGITTIINVGTSLPESLNCVTLAKQLDSVFATVGIHPNDCTATWRNDLNELMSLIQNQEVNKIVGIGECGIDRHHPDYNLSRQQDAFKAQIELALEHNLALVVHSRDAYDETLKILEQYSRDIKRATMHCFSYDQAYANTIISWGFKLGIGGTITYPKNDDLRTIVKRIKLSSIVLETDAPFLPPQIIRGKQNHPEHIKTIAKFIAKLRNDSLEDVEIQTTKSARQLFNLIR